MSLEWSSDPFDFMEEVKKSVKDLVEGTAIEVCNRAVLLTPVVSGELRASWNVSHTTPQYKRATGGSRDNVLPPPEIPRSLTGIPDYPVAYVTNGQPYAELVENGGPRNAPHYMLALAVEATKL